ncbi:MAG TPA: hypothetical protein VF746_15695 [Longimicrobium sp.]|jgi:hypothetical protein
MFQPPRPARRHGRPLLAALACGALLSCSDGIGPPGPDPDPPVAAALQVALRDPHPGVAGYPLPDVVAVRVVDAQGRGVPNAAVHLSVTSGGGSVSPAAAGTDANGRVTAMWTLGGEGAQTALARVEGLVPVELRARIVPVPETARPMLGALAGHIASTISRLEQSLPLNPQSASYIQARIDLLRTPGLGGDIVEAGRYAEGRIAARWGSVPVTAVFPAENMRAEAFDALRFAESAVPVVEGFLDTPFPTPSVRIWYGFGIGSSGGGGTLNLEDRGTYETRTPATRLPHDAITVHELSHSYVANESLTQFLELYGYNVLRTGTADVSAWTFTRGWVPGRDANADVHALLDVYQMIGPAAMAAAYRAALPLRPAYGQPLSAAVQQVFVDAAPAAVKSQVAAKIARVSF